MNNSHSSTGFTALTNPLETEPIRYGVNENEKYVIALFEVIGQNRYGDYQQYFQEEFDDLVVVKCEPGEHEFLICFRKGNRWGMYKYWWSEENSINDPRLFGYAFEQIEDFIWPRLAELLEKYAISLSQSKEMFGFKQFVEEHFQEEDDLILTSPK